MENFSFHNPTQIDFGKEKEKLIGEHLAKHGIKKVLLCFGSDRIKRDGLFDTVADSLAQFNISYVECGGIVSNPIMAKVYEGVQLAKTEKVDAILSVGGGSVLDSSKAIAAGALYEGDTWDLFIRKGTIEAALPIFDILTMAATGSEMNCGAVVTNEKTQQKYSINSQHTYPIVSIINPVLMQSVSNDYLVYSAADIIAHSIEGYFTASIHPHFQSRLVESIIKTVMETTEILLRDPKDYTARAEFAWASTQALNGLTYSGTAGSSYPNHMIEHSLSAIYNVPHGGGLSVIIPAWMKWYHPQNPEQFARFAKEIFNLETAEEGIAALENWFNKVGTPTRLGQFAIPASDLEKITRNVLGNAEYFGIGTIYTEDVITTILNNAF
ncbi:iron-containing alcohol dehydrogenase [Celerinatantimonas sp. YJH-8]|uniref:iron-containing alcohol dehydrogenase n=1 Tax=Celerinatantimonas sp. YJH-8 TaxID=3228714 RepID=UPI0038C448A5